MLIYDSALSNAKKKCPVEKKLTRLEKKIRLATWKVSILPFVQHTGGGNFLFARRHFYVRRPLECFEL